MAKGSYRTAGIVGLAFGLALIIACGMLTLRGAQGPGVGAGLAATARLAFLFFWPCYVAGPLVALFGPLFQPLRRLGRDLGLGFAAVEVAHLSLVARLCLIGDVPSRATFILFGSAAIVTAIIALLSFDFARRHLPNGVTRGFRWAGMHLIAYAFAVDFWRSPMSGGPKHVLDYLPFATLALAGPALHALSWTKAIGNKLRHLSYTMS
jgi:hypothetical protein